MSCEHLVCASCAHPVSEGRCAVCQASRAEVHHHHRVGISGPTLALLLTLLAALVVIAAHLGTA